MTTRVTLGWEGFNEFEELLDKMVEDFGEKDSKRILTRAVKVAMEPVLLDAKRNAPIDTGGLQASLQVEARKPTARDRRSKYVDRTDFVLATVTTAPSAKLARIRFFNQRNKTSKIQQVGIKSDARAIAMEFGTSRVAGKPYLRPALESNSSNVIDSLSETLRTEIERYKARQAKKMAKFTTG